MQKFRGIIFWLLDRLGINAFFARLNRDRAVILWYHGICADRFDLLKGYDERHIPQSLFRKQLQYLKKHGYRFATLTELAERLKNGDDIGQLVVLTFDDGFRNVVEKAYPVMQECGARGCFYLVSGLIGEKDLLWTDLVEAVILNLAETDFHFEFQGEKKFYRLSGKESRFQTAVDIKKKLRTLPDQERKKHLEQFTGRRPSGLSDEFEMSDWKAIRQLDPKILEAGSHTQHHPNCANLVSRSEFEIELKDSKTKIEKELNRSIVHFCYPAGSYSPETIGYLKEFNYKTAVTIIPGLVQKGDDLFELKRVSTTEDFLLFKAMVSGAFYSISAFKTKYFSKP